MESLLIFCVRSEISIKVDFRGDTFRALELEEERELAQVPFEVDAACGRIREDAFPAVVLERSYRLLEAVVLSKINQILLV